jgi:hypothetical protein
MAPPNPPRQGSLSYKRLNPSKNEFRLLELQPGRDVDDPVVCRLVTVSLNDDLEFLALSSLFGDATESEKIYVNGSTVTITHHLAQALRHVRQVFFPTMTRSGTKTSTKETRAPRWLSHLMRHVGTILQDPNMGDQAPLRLWVDILCINQNDDREKTGQIVSMAQIFRAAKMVVGWLGMKNDTTDAGIEVVRAVDDAMPLNWGDPKDKELHPENYSPHHAWARKIQHMWAPGPNGESGIDNDHWRGAADIQNRPYFQRGWILEEITMAKYPAFLIGDTIISWRQILRFNWLKEEFREYHSDIFPAEFRAAIYDWPLGTVHVLLTEFDKKRKAEGANAIDSSQSSQSTKIT